MKQKLPTHRMREQPDLEQLKRQAKQLFTGFKAGDSAAVDKVNAYYDGARAATFALHDAQLVIARSYGFDSWPKLKAYVDGVTIRRLVEAVRGGHVERVRTMLNARPELANMTVSYGDEHRAIHYAVMQRQPEIARLLMQNGANARAGIDPHRDATSAWTLAQERGYDEIVSIIEEEEERRAKSVPHRSRTQHPTPAMRPPVQLSRTTICSGCARILRKASSLIEFAGMAGGLLTVAMRNDRFEVLEFLLDRGASPNVHVDSSGSAVYSAYSHKQQQMVELLPARGGIVTADIAAIYRETDLARQMLIDDERGVLPQNVKTSDKPLAEELLRFGAGGATGIVRMALDRIDWARHDPRWFRMLASPLSFWHHIPWLYAGNKDFNRGSYLECFRLILNACDVNVVGSFGRTILHEIAAMGDWITEDEVATFGSTALEAGACMDRRDDILSSTPLGWACRWGRIQLVKLLVEYEADREEKDGERWARPRSWAQKMGHNEIVQVLN